MSETKKIIGGEGGHDAMLDQQAATDKAFDPIDTPLPCEIWIDNGVLHKGEPLRALVEVARGLNKQIQGLYDRARERGQSCAPVTFEVAVDYPHCRHIARIQEVKHSPGRTYLLVDGLSAVSAPLMNATAKVLRAWRDSPLNGKDDWLRDQMGELSKAHDTALEPPESAAKEFETVDTAEFRERLRGLGAAFRRDAEPYRRLVSYVNRLFVLAIASRSTENIDAERAAFEQACPGFNHQRTLEGGYVMDEVENYWQDWRTARRAAVSRAPSGAPKQEIPAQPGISAEQLFNALFSHHTTEALRAKLRDNVRSGRKDATLLWPDFEKLATFVNLAAASTVQSAPVLAENEGANEGLEILDQLIGNIEEGGNYSKEATLTFLGQIRQCFAAQSTPVQVDGQQPRPACVGWCGITNCTCMQREQAVALPVAAAPEALAEFKPGQWWLTELEKHWGHGESSDDTRRAAKVALDFASTVLAAAPEQKP